MPANTDIDLNNVLIYDLETFKHAFTGVFAHPSEKKLHIFEISERKNQSKQFFKYLRDVYKAGTTMVGFNNVGFDSPVLHYIVTEIKANGTITSQQIHEFATKVIESGNSEHTRFMYRVKYSELLFPQLDLYLINHFDNKARSTSLKMLEFNKRAESVKDLPYAVDAELTSEMIDEIIKYNKHDVRQTYEFYKECLPAIEFRAELTDRYEIDMMNANDTKIGKSLFIKRLEDVDKGCCYYYDETTRSRVMQQTIRNKINLSECVLPYIQFESPEFKAILDWFNSKTITETKGVLTDIPEHELGEVAKYATLETKKKKLPSAPTARDKQKLLKEHPCGWFEDVTLKSGKISHYFMWRIATNLNVVYEGIQYDFGTGGLHGAYTNTVLESNEENVILDLDYASYYPNLSIRNRLHPEHLGATFCDVYEELYDERAMYKKQPDSLSQKIQAALKLALNGTYGASNDKFSPFYDPKFTMSITINGQLTLCMLAERLVKVEGLRVVYINTDGLSVMCKRVDLERVMGIVKEFDKLTGLEMEENFYKVMYLRDVNNYIAVYETDGDKVKAKAKGAYMYEGLGHHQNQSALAVKKAAFEYIVNDIPLEKTLYANKDPFDFMLRTKVPRSSRLVVRYDDGTETPEQNMCRYFVSTKGGAMIKIMPPLPDDKFGTLFVDEVGIEYIAKNKTEETRYIKRGYENKGKVVLPKLEREIGIESGLKIKTCNDACNFNFDELNYDYYINEALKLVEFVKEHRK